MIIMRKNEVLSDEQALRKAKKVLGRGFWIYSGFRFADSWLFVFEWADGTMIFTPPLEVKKNGECKFFHRNLFFYDDEELSELHIEDIYFKQLVRKKHIPDCIKRIYCKKLGKRIQKTQKQ